MLYRGLKFTIIMSAIALLVLAGLVFYSFDNRENHKEENKTFMVTSVKGSVLSPINLEPISGIDLSVGEVSIKTSASGSYNFSNQAGIDYIRANHPELLRTLIFKAKSENQDIYFDSKLYNLLISIKDYECRNQLETIYEFLSGETKSVQSQDDFIKNYQVLFKPENISDQEIVISNFEIKDNWYSKNKVKYIKIYAITVDNQEKKKNYYFEYSESGFRLVE